MAKLSKDLSAGLLHPRENLWVTGVLASNGAEIIVDCDGGSSFSLNLRDTFNLTVEVSGTVDGTNWEIIPIRPRAGGIYVVSLPGAIQGIWRGECVGYRSIRCRCTSYTSGSAIATLLVSTAVSTLETALQGTVMHLTGTNTAAAGTAVTLTLAAPGAGLRQYLSYIRITRFAAALLTAAATPVNITTTNLPGSLAFTIPADALAQGAISEHREEFNRPLLASTQNTAVTVVAPATPNVIWRVTAGYYVAP